MEIRIQEIQRNPLPERDYMAPLTFVIEVSKIRLESMEDKGESLRFRKGESVTFRDARVRIRRGNAPGRPWEIAHISGIDVP